MCCDDINSGNFNFFNEEKRRDDRRERLATARCYFAIFQYKIKVGLFRELKLLLSCSSINKFMYAYALW